MKYLTNTDLESVWGGSSVLAETFITARHSEKHRMYTTHSDIEQTIDEEIRVMDGMADETLGMRREVNV